MNRMQTHRVMLLLAFAGMSWVAASQAAGAMAPENTGQSAGTVVNQQVMIAGKNYSGRWYLPSVQAEGVVYLQHGYSRNYGKVADLATSLMNRGLMVLSINAAMNQGAQAFALKVADQLRLNPPTPPNGDQWPAQLILSGHSAGGAHVGYIGGQLVTAGYPNLAGMILFDPVEGPDLQPHLQGVVDAGVPVRAILANSGSCNAQGGTHADLGDLTGTDFTGIKLTNRSSHVDAEGGNTDWLMRFFCGAPQSYNVELVQSFAAAWAVDMVAGSFNADYYPGGIRVLQLYDEGLGHLIKE
jgi:hypothetical protein